MGITPKTAGKVTGAAGLVAAVGFAGYMLLSDKPEFVPPAGTQTWCGPNNSTMLLNFNQPLLSPPDHVSSARARYGPCAAGGCDDNNRKCITEEFEGQWFYRYIQWKGLRYTDQGKEDFGHGVYGGQPLSFVLNKQYCDAHPEECAPPPPNPCGNGQCDANETYLTCPKDCPKPPPTPVCGDGKCEGTETSLSCPDDCGSPCPPERPCPTCNQIDLFEVERTRKMCESWNLLNWQKKSACDHYNWMKTYKPCTLPNTLLSLNLYDGYGNLVYAPPIGATNSNAYPGEAFEGKYDEERSSGR